MSGFAPWLSGVGVPAAMLRALCVGGVALVLASCDTSIGKDDVDVGDEVGDDTDDSEDTDSDTDPADEDDTDVVDTDVVDTDVVDTDAGPPEFWHHIVQVVHAMPAAQGFDVDGDGTVDNVAGTLDNLLNSLIDANYGTVPIYAVTQVWGIDDGDDLADIGVLAARDMDDDPSDNFNGTEEVRANAGVDTLTGHALTYGVAEIDANGEYETRLPAGMLQIGPFAIPVATDIQIRGRVTANAHEGQLGGAIARDDLLLLMSLAGLDDLAFLVTNLADVDTDGDGEPDAISAAFEFQAVACVLRP